MRPLHKAAGDNGVVLAAGALDLAFPPTDVGWVDDWNTSRGVVPEFDLEVWANATVSLTAAELFGASLQALVLADDDVDAVDATDNELDITGHVYLTGDGPVRIATSGALPGGLAAATDYYIIVVDADSIAFATSRANAIAGTKIDLTSAGSGTHTISDTADTRRLHWHSYGLLGFAGDGAIALSAQRSYVVRCNHRPRTVAYAIIATLSASDPEAVSAAVYPVLES